MKVQPHFLESVKGQKLFVKEWVPDIAVSPVPILFIHGAIENGRIFYSDSGKGLAPFLARAGFRCLVLDRRGRGLSTPRISGASTFGQWEEICEDLPAFAEFAKMRADYSQLAWISHSWGGVLVNSTLARFSKLRSDTQALVYFGTKRSVRAKTGEAILKVHLFWNRLSRLLARWYGFLPAETLGVGSDRETLRTLDDSVAWVRPSPWVDPTDGFDYGKAVEGAVWPPALWYAGAVDHALGHPDDVRDTMNEAGFAAETYRLLAKTSGCAKDYGHIDMLTDPLAEKDHFEETRRFLSECIAK